VGEPEVGAVFGVVEVELWAHGAEGLVASAAGMPGLVLCCSALPLCLVLGGVLGAAALAVAPGHRSHVHVLLLEGVAAFEERIDAQPGEDSSFAVSNVLSDDEFGAGEQELFVEFAQGGEGSGHLAHPRTRSGALPVFGRAPVTCLTLGS
jgi:hypothetical protein